MPRGSSDEGEMTMMHKLKVIPNGRSKSSSTSRPARNTNEQKATRKSSVADSLMKFLDVCDDEDLLMNTTETSKTKRPSLSMSEHGSSVADPLFTPTDRPKRRSTKKDRIRSPKSSSSDRVRTPLTRSHSEHGTPSTQKKTLDNFTPRSDGSNDDDENDDDDISVSSESVGADEGDLPQTDRNARASSRQRRSRSSSQSGTHEKRERVGSSSFRKNRVKRSTSERSTSERSTKSTRSKSGSSRSGSRGGSFRGSTREERAMDTKDSANNSPMNLDKQLSKISKSSSRRRNRRSNDDDDRSVSSGRSSFTSASTTRTNRPLGLDAGPLNAFLNFDQRLTRGSSGGASVGPGIHPGRPSDEKFLTRCKSRQDEIMKLAQKDLSKKSKEEDAKHKTPDLHATLHDDILDGKDDDQPMVKGKKKKSALARFKNGISKTGKATKNVVKDPKSVVKKVGGFANAVGKETAHMVLNPKLAAKTAATLGMDVTKSTYKVTKGVGKGVAKGGLDLTKSVAQSGVNATTKVVGTALDGAGKVVHGATGLIFKHGNDEQDEEFAEYKASELQCRRKTSLSLMDRIADKKETGITMPATPIDGKETRTMRRMSSTRKTSVGVPTLMDIGGSTGGNKHSWDF